MFSFIDEKEKKTRKNLFDLFYLITITRRRNKKNNGARPCRQLKKDNPQKIFKILIKRFYTVVQTKNSVGGISNRPRPSFYAYTCTLYNRGSDRTIINKKNLVKQKLNSTDCPVFFSLTIMSRFFNAGGLERIRH